MIGALFVGLSLLLHLDDALDRLTQPPGPAERRTQWPSFRWSLLTLSLLVTAGALFAAWWLIAAIELRIVISFLLLVTGVAVGLWWGWAAGAQRTEERHAARA